MTDTKTPLLQVKGLKKHFPVKSRGLIQRKIGAVCAVDGIDFHIDEGETLGIVGESGCGKTTVGKTILRLYQPTDGQVLFEGTDVFQLNKTELQRFRQKMQIIFQDPYSSLNPRMTVEEIVAEPLKIYRVCSGAELQKRVSDLLTMVGLSSWHARRYPHEFSGGQRQRVGIARALALNPQFIVCDEPVSALDVSVQSQVLNLLMELQRELKLSYLFVAHGMAVVKHVSDRIGVMYLGKMMEIAPKKDIYAHPAHPYTRALMSAIPIPDPDVQVNRITLSGEVPSPINPPPGCRFSARCGSCMARCTQEEPQLREIAQNHFVACHLYDGQTAQEEEHG